MQSQILIKKDIPTMTTANTSGLAPIYDSMVAEHGDVPTETREAAEEIQREVAEVLDWNRFRPGD